VSGWTLSASCYCSGGHNTLADSIRTPDTSCESGRNLLAYRVRGGHYPRPDAIHCDTGMSGDSLGHPGMVPPILPGLSCTRMSGDSLGHPRMVPPLLPPQIVCKSYLGIASNGH